jgi:MbtH protein
MNIEDREHNASYKVVVNDEGQFSTWPAERENPVGWRDGGRNGSKAECLAHIKEVWTDMRPIALRKSMEKRESQMPGLHT